MDRQQNSEGGTLIARASPLSVYFFGPLPASISSWNFKLQEQGGFYDAHLIVQLYADVEKPNGNFIDDTIITSICLLSGNACNRQVSGSRAAERSF